MLTNLISRLFSRDAVAPVEDFLRGGYALQQAGDRPGAERQYRAALKAEPQNADAHYLLGALLGEGGAYAEAGAHIDHALAQQPENAQAHAARGNIYLMLGELGAAAQSYEQALHLDPANAVASFNFGLLLQKNGERQRAFGQFQRAYELAPAIPDLLKNLTLSHLEFERYSEAETLLKAVLAREPRQFEALKCIGLVLQKTHRPREALEYYEKARAVDSGDAEFLNNYGIVLQDLGRLDEAIEKYDASIALEPDYTLAIWHRSLAYLLRHDFARGWPDYELRMKSIDLPRRPVEFPRWSGDSLTGKSLLVYAEQGLGDEIMFASCIPDVIDAGAQVTIECSPKLEPIFCRSFPAASVTRTATANALSLSPPNAALDCQIAIGSLPLHFRRGRLDFPRRAGYLRADPVRMAAWRERLAELGPGLKVGISWQGGTHKSRRPVRSLPLARWEPILKVKNTHFIDLQYTDCSSELAAMQEATGTRVHSWETVRTDYEETAALVSSLDLVISVCTAVIHLGGALGQRVWVMAPFSPEWRYGSAGEDMPWYPTVRVHRQPEYGNWDAVVDQVVRSLREFADACPEHRKGIVVP